MGDASIIRNLMKAGVPRHVWKVSTTGTGRAELREFAREVAGRDTLREAVTCAYLNNADKAKRVESLEILAKEMVLAGEKCLYTPFSKLMRDIRVQVDQREGALYEVFSRGAIVVPEIPTRDQFREEQAAEYDEVVEYLVSHAYLGGVLCISGDVRVSKKYTSKWPFHLERLLMEGSEIFGSV